MPNHPRTNDLEETLLHGRDVGRTIRKFIAGSELSRLLDEIREHMLKIPKNDSTRLVNMYDQGLIDGLSDFSSERDFDIGRNAGRRG